MKANPLENSKIPQCYILKKPQGQTESKTRNIQIDYFSPNYYPNSFHEVLTA